MVLYDSWSKTVTPEFPFCVLDLKISLNAINPVLENNFMKDSLLHFHNLSPKNKLVSELNVTS